MKLFFGIDIGTTTTHAVALEAKISKNCITGRMEFVSPSIIYQSPVVFTPYHNGEIDLSNFSQMWERWLVESQLRRDDLVGGGAILTGLAAESSNRNRLKDYLLKELGSESVIVAADPGLESWVSFMASVQTLSRSNPHLTFLHLDIGGGTTNVALGKDGVVKEVGSFFIGARHLQFYPGTFQLVGFSKYGERLLKYFGIEANLERHFSQDEIGTIVSAYEKLLEDLVCGRSSGYLSEVAQMDFKTDSADVITFSGGVGELIYSPDASRTRFGDLGQELADAIRQSPVLSKSLSTFIPDCKGRATVMGMAIHTVDLSGSTSYICDPKVLPLRDIPILGVIHDQLADASMEKLIELALHLPQGGALQIEMKWSLESVRVLGEKLFKILENIIERGRRLEDPARPKAESLCGILVLLVSENIGKTLGELVTHWRTLPVKLCVIDEIPKRRAQFIKIGKLQEGVLPVTFYGIEK